ncbi:hypothetical protein BDZ89DRAFT_99243 [Hymenopellis radicata]|nr:hypothetical protein BDZ89DRAFT_99243 [Hymenopellis radicata]
MSDKQLEAFAHVASSDDNDDSDDVSDITPPLPTRWSASDRPRSPSLERLVLASSTSSTEPVDASSSDSSDVSSDEAEIISPPEPAPSTPVGRGTRTEQQSRRQSRFSSGHAHRSIPSTAVSNSHEAKRVFVDDTTPNLPRAPHNRARRVLIPVSADLPIVTVSMRADIQFFHRKARSDATSCTTLLYLMPHQDIAFLNTPFLRKTMPTSPMHA